MEKIERKIASFESETFDWENEISNIDVEIVKETDEYYVANVMVEESNGDYTEITEANYPKVIIDNL